MALTGISFAKENHLVSRKDPAYSERALNDIDFAREEGATIFRWKAIPNSIITRIKDSQAQSSMTMGDVATQTFNARTAHRNREAFRYGVIGIENYPDQDGNPIQAVVSQILEVGGVPCSVVSEDTLNSVHSNIIDEIGNDIFNRCSMGDEDRKKFEAVLSQLDGSPTSNAGNAVSDNAANEDASDQPSSTPTTQTAKSTPTGKTPRPKKTKTAAPDV